MELGPTLVTTARTIVEMLREEHFDEVVALFAPPLRAAVPAGALEAAWTAKLGERGPVTGIGDPDTEPAGAGLVRIGVPVHCERGDLTVLMSIDEGGLLQGLQLAPATSTAWTPPPYADPAAFTEHDVTIDAGSSAVAGTLTVPSGPGSRPGVVLLPGGGPFDRDETSGPNKPLKDLAWGLACRGVATLRFDKITHTRPEATSTPGFTMSDEYVPHAAAAVRLLRQESTVDDARVFVLGHSMGGKVAPRVAAAEPSVAGLLILAGDTQPMHHAAIRVARHLATVAPGLLGQDAVDLFARQAANVDSPGLSPGTPAADLPFGFSASYWLDLRDYDPVATAAALDRPMLILQGGRDYQVTVEDDLSRWQAGLSSRPDVTIHVHADDDHLFFPGTGPSTPADYEKPHHVDPAVIDDIADWLASGRAKACPQSQRTDWPDRSGPDMRWRHLSKRVAMARNCLSRPGPGCETRHRPCQR
ncbi:alpha/beta fold hydrolase [Amycolatopsis umgeniensis]|uniref:Dienelactone hydrolase n=1 Tax=Amycolatopsis umgeniensis TaxID=336628 RepID=A0A841BEW2_9PSEU|nr:alpha/beta hydrolase [Amycolatopsis umgeniensis]MBB5857441.1 dienelactone hydrolase [Amycolatopsis umgeniensis]